MRVNVIIIHMNILRIVYDFADKNVSAEGLSTGPYELTLAQGKLGHKIFVLTGNLNGKNFVARNFSYKLGEGNITVYNLPRGLKHFGPFLTTSVFVLPYYFYIKKKFKIDLVHNHQQMGVWLLLYKKLVGKMDKTPIIHTNHGSIVARMDALKKQGVKSPFFTKYFEYPIHKFSDSLSMQVAQVVVAVSKNLQEELPHYYPISKDKVVLMENGVNLDKFHRTGEKVDFGFENGSIIIGNVGRLSERKNIHLIIESLKFLPMQYKLVLVGEWDEKYKKDVVDKILLEKDLDGGLLSSRVKYIGIKPYWEVDKVFRSFDLFILPSAHEGLPKVALEAIASGNKCIASGFELERSLTNLYFLDELTPEAIAQKILSLSETPNNYEIARDILEKYYSWDTKVKELERMLPVRIAP